MRHKTTLYKAFTLATLAAFCSVIPVTGAFADEPPRISHNEPQIAASEPEPIPVVDESKVPTWIWIVGGALVIGGGAAAAAGGGGGGSSSSPSSPPPVTSSNGSSTVTW